MRMEAGDDADAGNGRAGSYGRKRKSCFRGGREKEYAGRQKVAEFFRGGRKKRISYRDIKEEPFQNQM